MASTSLDLSRVRSIHLMGVGGAGMSGLALLYKALGFQVTGCDMGNSCYTTKVREAGVPVYLGHDPHHLDDHKADILAYSSAIPSDNPELVTARERGIPVVQRAELLSLLFNSRCGVGVAGTHGKTTTTSMISLIAERAGLEPTVAIGGELCDIGCNAKLGNGNVMVAELDESDGSFQFFQPSVAVVTNVDWDHVNYYPSRQSVVDAFVSFLANVPSDGFEVLCGDDPGVRALLGRLEDQNCQNRVTYGLEKGNDFYPTNLEQYLGGGMSYSLNRFGRQVGRVRLTVSGTHNLLNSLAALAAGSRLGISFDLMVSALNEFHGVKRRLQQKGNAGDDILVYDDYGHHPNEVKATLTALGQMFPKRRLVVVFQPHRYTRTAALYEQFAQVLSQADQVILLPIYAADEQQIPGVSSSLIQDKIHERHPGLCHLVRDKVDAEACVMSVLQPGDLLLTAGAGDVCVIGDLILQNLKAPCSATA